MLTTMESAEWESVLQYVSEPLEFSSPLPVAETTVLSLLDSQIPTPPDSDQGSPGEERDGNTVVSVSTTFFPGASLSHLPPDLIFLSSDAVFFYVHSNRLLSVSDNSFSSLLPPNPLKGKPSPVQDMPPIISLSDSAQILNIVLHTAYDISCAHYSPTLDTLIAAVDALSRYGLPPKTHVAPSTTLYTLLLAQAPMAPIDVYALAAAHDLYDLAVPVSSHLLAFALPSLTDEHAARMGPLYLRRLFFLHLGRTDALKRILLPPPPPHAPTSTCDFTEQKKLTRAWALASAYLAWDARPDLSTSSMEAALCPLGNHLSCDVCQKALGERIKQLIVQWSVVRRTI